MVGGGWWVGGGWRKGPQDAPRSPELWMQLRHFQLYRRHARPPNFCAVHNDYKVNACIIVLQWVQHRCQPTATDGSEAIATATDASPLATLGTATQNFAAFLAATSPPVGNCSNFLLLRLAHRVKRGMTGMGGGGGWWG